MITLEIKKEKKKESQGNKMWTNEHWQFFSLGFSLLISEKKSSHVFLYAKYCGHRYAPDVASNQKESELSWLGDGWGIGER